MSEDAQSNTKRAITVAFLHTFTPRRFSLALHHSVASGRVFIFSKVIHHVRQELFSFFRTVHTRHHRIPPTVTRHPPRIMTSVEDATALKDQGNTAFKEHQFPLAVEFYTKAIEANPNEKTYYTNRAQASDREPSRNFRIGLTYS